MTAVQMGNEMRQNSDEFIWISFSEWIFFYPDRSPGLFHDTKTTTDIQTKTLVYSIWIKPLRTCLRTSWFDGLIGSAPRAISITSHAYKTGWWWMVAIFLFSQKYWECHHPLIDELIFFRGVAQPPTRELFASQTILMLAAGLIHKKAFFSDGTEMTRKHFLLSIHTSVRFQEQWFLPSKRNCIRKYKKTAVPVINRTGGSPRNNIPDSNVDMRKSFVDVCGVLYQEVSFEVSIVDHPYAVHTYHCSDLHNYTYVSIDTVSIYINLYPSIDDMIRYLHWPMVYHETKRLLDGSSQFQSS